MELTIVQPDNLTIIDKTPQRFDLSGYGLPANLWALQWRVTDGEVEYTDQPNEHITTLPGWTLPIIEEHQRLTEEQAICQEKQAREAVFLVNGSARQERIQQQKITRIKQEQQRINNFVMEQM